VHEGGSVVFKTMPQSPPNVSSHRNQAELMGWEVTHTTWHQVLEQRNALV